MACWTFKLLSMGSMVMPKYSGNKLRSSFGLPDITRSPRSRTYLGKMAIIVILAQHMNTC